MPLFKRVAISLALMGGIIAGIVAFYKISLVSEISAEAKQDPTYADTPLVFWTVIEVDILITAASLPAIGPFWRWVRDISVRLYSGSKASTRPLKPDTNWRSPDDRSRWFGHHHKGLTSLGSEQDDIHLVAMGASATSADGAAAAPPTPGSHEIVKTVDIQAKTDRTTSRDRADRSMYLP
ncbi:MAG: hypothetical protein Q9162_005291 [Coniocarpon cinnabarinum]